MTNLYLNMKLLVLVTVISATIAHDLSERRPVKRSYVCPPKFIRQGHRCYYFSKDVATWQEAMFRCRDMHSNIAIIKNAHQDELIRRVLSKKSLDPTQRWLGGVYDWQNMTWKWAASGKLLTYSGFPQSDGDTDKESLRWQCIIMDPSLEYKWSSRSCVEKKHFICQTKIRTVTHKDKKKLQRQYNANKYNKLNEILAPSLPEYENGTFSLKSNVPIQYRFEINKNLNDEAMFAFSPKDTTVKERKRKRKRKSRKLTLKKLANGTLIEVPKLRKRGSRKKKQNELMDSGQHTLMKNIRWRTYKKKEESNPLYPSPIVEEYNYVKEY